MAAPDSPTRSPLTGVTVLDAMNPGVVSCLSDDGVAKVASIMVTHGIHAVVLARGDRTGPLIVTDLELVRAALERADAHAAEIAREPLASLPADAPLDQAVAMMAERYVAHLLATDPVSGVNAEARRSTNGTPRCSNRSSQPARGALCSARDEQRRQSASPAG
jgi:CBS domain-containing protein